jgi:hypothetical protein
MLEDLVNVLSNGMLVEDLVNVLSNGMLEDLINVLSNGMLEDLVNVLSNAKAVFLVLCILCTSFKYLQKESFCFL